MAKDRTEDVRAGVLQAIARGNNSHEELLQASRQIAPNHEHVLREMVRDGVIKGTIKNVGGNAVHRYITVATAQAVSTAHTPAKASSKVVTNG